MPFPFAIVPLVVLGGTALVSWIADEAEREAERERARHRQLEAERAATKRARAESHQRARRAEATRQALRELEGLRRMTERRLHACRRGCQAVASRQAGVDAALRRAKGPSSQQLQHHARKLAAEASEASRELAYAEAELQAVQARIAWLRRG